MSLGVLILSAMILDGGQMDELRISLADCPVAVQKSLWRESFATEIRAVYKEGEDEEAIYEAEIVLDGKKYEVRVDSEGVLLEKEWEEEDKQIPLIDCPFAVQKTLRRESFGARIETVEEESVYGRTNYEADVLIEGRQYEIKVTSDGALISKKQCLGTNIRP